MDNSSNKENDKNDNAGTANSFADKGFVRPAGEHSEWKWLMLWQARTLLCHHGRPVSHTDPDTFVIHLH